ncbi:MAG: hypothetical protein QW445_07605 [Candidatus Bathyarchaeia archaeon]
MLFNNALQTSAAQMAFDVTACDLVKTAAPNRVLLSITVKNSGSQAMSTVLVTIYDDTGAAKPTNGKQILTDTLSPGSSISASITDVDIGTSFTVGKKYAVQIRAGDGGNIATKTITVTCTG